MCPWLSLDLNSSRSQSLLCCRFLVTLDNCGHWDAFSTIIVSCEVALLTRLSLVACKQEGHIIHLVTDKHRPALGGHSEMFIALVDKLLMSSFQVILRFVCSGATQGQEYEASLLHGLDTRKHAFLWVILFFQRRLETFKKVLLLGFLTLSYEEGTG